MQDGAVVHALHQAVRGRDTDSDSAPEDPNELGVEDVEGGAIRHVDAERLERLLAHEAQDVFGLDHISLWHEGMIGSLENVVNRLGFREAT